MRVALINNVPKIWALGKYAYELHNELSKKNHVDHLYFDFEKRELRIENKETLKEDRSLFNNKLFFLLKLKKYLPEYNINHITNQNISFILNSKRQAKNIVTCHDIYPYIYPKNLVEKQFRRFIYSGMKRANIIISDSKNTKKDLVKFFGLPEEKIKVIYLGVDKKFKKIDKMVARKKLGIPEDKKILMHVGEDSIRKNTSRIYKAYFKAKKEFNNLTLIRIGKVDKKISGVEYLYKVSDKEMTLLYNAADILLIPSIYEGFGFPVIEAFACGTVVISSKVSSLPEIVGDAGILVNPYKTEEISNAITKLINDESLCSDLMKRGLTKAKKFTWKKCADEVFKVYKELE